MKKGNVVITRKQAGLLLNYLEEFEHIYTISLHDNEYPLGEDAQKDVKELRAMLAEKLRLTKRAADGERAAQNPFAAYIASAKARRR
jgi:hypothetical protein